jgi:hypothetical protein
VNGCAGVRRTLDLDRAADCFDSVDQPGQTGPARRVRAAVSIVADNQLEPAVVAADPDLGQRRVRMLGRIGQGFSGHVVRGDLDRLLEPISIEVDPKVDGNRRTSRERLQRRAETVLR